MTKDYLQMAKEQNISRRPQREQEDQREAERERIGRIEQAQLYALIAIAERLDTLLNVLGNDFDIWKEETITEIEGAIREKLNAEEDEK